MRVGCCQTCDGEGFRHDSAGPSYEDPELEIILFSHGHDCPDCGGTGEVEDE